MRAEQFVGGSRSNPRARWSQHCCCCCCYRCCYRCCLLWLFSLVVRLLLLLLMLLLLLPLLPLLPLLLLLLLLLHNLLLSLSLQSCMLFSVSSMPSVPVSLALHSWLGSVASMVPLLLVPFVVDVC